MRRKKDKSNGITALYERLSRDDDNAGESNSIVHQKQMLEDYAMKHGFTNLVHFTDDGWSGATFDRPSWNRLVEGVKNGEITACICKDMSRIGRDHLQVGFFTDILFREKEVRFIAINNGIDSDRQETSEFAPFLNIMNEWFVRDTSKKIKAVLKSRGSSGNAHTSNIPPYGYLKDPENPDHWIIDEEAAEVVRRIYRMTIEGKGPYQIARELSEEKIERPFKIRKFGVSDVIGLTAAGKTSFFYVDKDRLVRFNGFFPKPQSGTYLILDEGGYQVAGQKGTWLVSDEVEVDGQRFVQMRSEQTKNPPPSIILHESGAFVTQTALGFDGEATRKMSAFLQGPKPELLHHQKFFENGTAERAKESGTEQNYNMIDGCVNNVPQKPRRIGGRWSVLDRLHIKQAERRQKDNTPQQEQERSRKS